MKLKSLSVAIVLGSLFSLTHTITAAPVMAFTANTYAVGANPMTVATGDFNGDGWPDIVTANYGNGGGRTLTILTNNGSGDFGSNATPIVGTPFPFVPPEGSYQKPYAVAAIDVNGDSKLDFAITSYDNGVGNQVTVMTNNGAGIFSSNAILTVGIGPKAVIGADVNGDGKVDLVTANYTAGTLTILTNAGNGTFGSNATLRAFSRSGFVLAADLNNDGKIDLVSVSDDSFASLTPISRMVIFTNTGAGVFSSNATLILPYISRQAVALDANGDGKMDLAAYANLNGMDSIALFTNNGTGNFSSATSIPLNQTISYSMTSADMNGDGKVDLISANVDRRITVLINDGHGNFPVYSVPGVGRIPYFTTTADVNGDGKMDLITVNNLDNTVTVLTQTNVQNPSLEIGVKTNFVSVSWQSLATGFLLETNSDLRSTNWAMAPYLYAYVASTSNIVIQNFGVTSLPPDKLFFRFKP